MAVKKPTVDPQKVDELLAQGGDTPPPAKKVVKRPPASQDAPAEQESNLQDESVQEQEPGQDAGAKKVVKKPAATVTKPKAPWIPGVAIKTRTSEDRIPYLNILDYGMSGTGKTQFSGTMVKSMEKQGKKVFYLSFNEDELQTLDRTGVTGYDYHIVQEYAKLWEIYLMLKRNAAGYGGVIIDGLGDFQQAAKDYDLTKGRTDDATRKSLMLGNTRMQINNWGNLLELTRHFLDDVLRLPLHVIVTCISKIDEHPTSGKLGVFPALQGSMQELINAHFSVVAYSYIAQWGTDFLYCMATQPHDSISTKDRSGLSRVLINPQFQTFVDALEGKIPARTDQQKRLAQSLIITPPEPIKAKSD